MPLYVVPAYQGRGLGKRLVQVMIEEGPGVAFRWLLHTADAHELVPEVWVRGPRRDAFGTPQLSQGGRFQRAASAGVAQGCRIP